MKSHKSTIEGSQRHYGLLWQEKDRRDFVFRPTNRLVMSMPDHFDLSNPKLPAPFEPCLNQGAEGSCGPNTTAELLCIDRLRDEGAVEMKLPSRQFIYYNTRVLMGTVNQDSGVDNRTMLKAVNQWGWCDDTLCPYTDDVRQIGVKPSAEAYNQAITRKILQYEAVPQDQNSIMACIAAGTGFIFGFSVYQSFESPQTAATGLVMMPTNRDGKSIGGHDISAVGYNFTGNYLPGELPQNKWPTNTIKCRNHWYNGSVPWGDRGYCYVPLAYFLNTQISGDFWRIMVSGLPVVTPPSPTPTPTPAGSRVLTIIGSNLALSLDGKSV